jgi:hypothetical protein
MENTNPNEQAWSADSFFSEGPSLFMPMLINCVVVILLSGLMVVAYHYFYVKKLEDIIPLRTAILDIEEVLAVKQLQASIQLMRFGNNEQNATKLYNDITAFGKQLEEQVKQIQDECDCVLVVKAAVVASNKIDNFTEILKERLGLGGLTKEGLTKEFGSLSAPQQQPSAPANIPGMPQYPQMPQSTPNMNNLFPGVPGQAMGDQ